MPQPPFLDAHTTAWIVNTRKKVYWHKETLQITRDSEILGWRKLIMNGSCDYDRTNNILYYEQKPTKMNQEKYYKCNLWLSMWWYVPLKLLFSFIYENYLWIPPGVTVKQYIRLKWWFSFASIFSLILPWFNILVLLIDILLVTQSNERMRNKILRRWHKDKNFCCSKWEDIESCQCEYSFWLDFNGPPQTVLTFTVGVKWMINLDLQ